MGNSAISVFDKYLAPSDHGAVFDFLSQPGWAFGAHSDSEPNARRYFYKHFAGIFADGRQSNTTAAIEEELRDASPLLGNFWEALKRGPLQGQALSRCYANAMPSGIGGGVHLDSDIDGHLTTIYYPHPEWHASFGGETLFFNPDASDIVSALYPKPNRLAVFPGTIPHVARATSQRFTELRITLMFKTMPAKPAIQRSL
jgi:SM-20-related protein